jgi:hypothetical protein
MPQIFNGKVPIAMNGAGAVKEFVILKEKPAVHLVPVRSASVVTYLLWAAGGLLSLHLLVVLAILAGDAYKLLPAWQPTFYFDKEGNLPSFFATFILLLSAFLLAVVAAIKRKEKDYFARYWAGLAIIFLCMAVDEAAGIHEVLLARFSAEGTAYIAWGMAGGALVLVFAVVYYQFYRSLNRVARRGFFIAGACFLLGALGLEMLGASLLSQGYSDRDLAFLVVMTAEEVLEMSSIIYFISTLLNYLKPYTTFGFVIK